MRAAISNLVGLTQQCAEERPDGPALIFISGGDLQPQVLTYAQLDFRARTVAAFLQGLSLQGERAVLLYPPGLEFVAAFLGCLYAGVIAVPAYPPRINRNALRIVSIAEDSQASVALTTAAIASRRHAFVQHTPELGKMRWVATDDLDPVLVADWREFIPAEDGLAYLQYTSGSTAAPRGVMVTHANILHNSDYIAAGFEHSSESVSLCWLPHFHDMGLIDGIIQPLYSGFPGYLMSPTSFLQEPVRWLEAISRYRVTHSGGPDFAYDLCSKKVSAEQRQRLDLSSWRVAYDGAEPVHARTLELFAEQFGPCGFRSSAFYPAYGLAEATLKVSGGKKDCGPAYCTVTVKASELEQNRIQVTHLDDPEGRTLVGSGRVSHGVKVVVVHPGSHIECSLEEIGEIWVSGPSVAAGYWNRQEETSEVFGAFVKSSGDGPFLRTGDLGFVHDGEIFVTGRLKDLIIIRGRNHYPQDIERTVQLSHPVLQGMSGAAFSVGFGTSEKVAIVQEIDPRRSNLFAKVIKDVRRAVADEHEIQPHAILLLKSGSVPRTSSGKVQRQLCRQKFLENSFKALVEWRDATPENAATCDDAAPLEWTADSVQLWLRTRFAAKLSTGVSEIHEHQPIQQFGLDSLMALEISHNIESALGISLSQRSLLEGWSIAGLAEHILSQLDPVSLDAKTAVVTGAAVPDQYPLSQGQQALWFLQQLAPESRAYYIARALRLKAEIDAVALRRAFQKLVDRHASLRTVFALVDGKPMQHVYGQAAIFFEHEDASLWDSRTLSERLTEAANQPFDLSRGPLFRVFLFSTSACDHLLLLEVHHIVADLWSLGLLLNELSEIYAGKIRDVPADLPSPAIHYADYVNWEEKFLQTEEGERHWHYWRKQLEGDLSILELPIDFPRPPLQTYDGAASFTRLDAELVCKLKSAALHYQASLYTLLIALFETFLHRYTGHEDVLIGAPTTGRSRHQFAQLVGYLVNPVVIRMDFSDDPTFEHIMLRGRRVVLEALEHQAFPFATLVQRLQPQRDPSRSPLFQVMFVLQKTSLLPNADLAALALGAPETKVQLGDLVLESASLEHRIAQFDLTLAMAEVGGEMVASFEYNTNLFVGATMDRLMRHFLRLIQECIAQPAKPISEILLLSDEDCRQVLLEWNQTERKYPVHETVLGLLEAQARTTPEASAVIFEGQRWTYLELHQQANQLARFLKKRGVGPEVAVGVCMERSAQLVMALLGIMKAGGAYVPLDPSYPVERLDYMLDDAGLGIVVVSKVVREGKKLRNAGARVVCLEEAEEWKAISAESQEAVASGLSGENLAYVIYTSGSTGKPKGVMNVHRGLLNRLQWMQEAYGLDETDRVLQKTPFGFDVSVWEFFWPLMYGASVVVARPEGHKDSQYLVRTIQQERITAVHFVPSMLGAFLQEAGVEECRSLRRVMASGEALPAPVVKKFHKRLRAELHNLYGPTEASIDVSFWACPRQQVQGTSIPIGLPIANTQLYILDSHMQPAPVGVRGELFIGGVGLARGYRGKAEWTAEKFIPDPFCQGGGERLYRTGDVARRRGDGQIEYVGRNDEQIKLRGFRIELGEIEAVLGQHEAVQQAVVVAQDAAGEKKLIAYVVAAGGVQLSTAALRSYVQGKLPEYMVPAAIVELEALPLSAHGKVNRKVLPRWESWGAEAEYRRPRTPTEELLSGIWSEVLGVERVGIDDNFFEFGGHSLLATQVMSRARETLLVDLPLHAFFETPTIAGLSQRIDQAKSGGQFSTSVQISHVGHRTDVPLSFAQERMWFLHQIVPDKSAYSMIEGLRLSGELDLAALSASLQKIIERHEVLRASFVAVEGRCIQRIAPTSLLPLEIMDLQKQRDLVEVRELVRQETRKPFDLAQAPLLRATLLKSAEHEHILLLAMHHLVADGWSFGVLLRELKELYRAHARNEVPRLHELQIQYADYAEWQRQLLTGGKLESQLAYWKDKLAGASQQLLLPTDHPRPAVQSFCGKRFSFELSQQLTNRLKEFSRQHSVTLFMALLTVLKVLLARYAGQEDVVVGSVVANRNRREIEGLIGLFVNTLVLRTELACELSVVDVLQRIREVCLAAYLHQEVPFEKLVAELEPERDLSRTPVFQVMFAWQILPVENWQMDGLRLARLPVEEESETTKFDLSFLIGESPDGLVGVIEYSSDLFETRTVGRMFALYRQLLEEVVRESSQKIWEIPLLSETERQQLLVEWNSTWRALPQDSTIVQMIEQQAARQPGAPAVRDQKQEFTYWELNQKANQWAHRLRKMGVQAEARVGICMKRGAEMVAAQLGVLKAGGAYVPLDWEHPAERLQYQISDSGARVLIIDHAIREKLQGLGHVQMLCVDEEPEVLRDESAENPGWEVRREQLAYVIYTSGSTGRPKGVEIEHRGLLNLVQWHQQAYGIAAGERGSQVAGVGFDASVWETWPYLAAGASLEIAGDDERGSAEKLREWLAAKDVTISFLPTPLAEAVIRLGDWKPQHLKRILTGGDRLQERPPESWVVELVNHYGPTECTVVATAAAVEKRGGRCPTIGRPISNTRVYVLDDEMQPVPVGMVGELYIGGTGLARGYVGRAELTAERFVPDGLSGEAGERLYRTGDQCRRDETGELEFLGRKDQQVKIRGHRIEVGEIEAVLKEHREVREAVVAVQERERGEKVLIAYVVTAQEKRVDGAELRQYLQSKLPGYMVPSAFMQLEAIPLTASGKVDRHALKKWEFISSDQQDPRTETESLLAGIWKELLRLERVGIHDIFFELGGDSIISLQVVARAQQQGIQVTPRQLFECPTIAALAAVAERVGRQEEITRQVAVKGEAAPTAMPLSPMQKGMLFEYLSAPQSGVYVQQLICTLRGSLEIEAFRNAWQQAIEHHSILRTLFIWDQGEEPFQVVRTRAAVPLEVRDWNGIPESEQQQQLQSLLAADRARGFTLSEAPLLRLTLLQITPDVCQWLLTFHHLILDGWSLPLLFKEVLARYGEQIGGEAYNEPPVHPYSDYIQWLQKQDLSAAETYWRQTLQGFSAPTKIIINSAGHLPDGEHGFFEQQIQFSPQETMRLQSTARQQGITLSILVQAAWAILLSRYSSEEDIVFGLTVSGRSARLTGIDTMIGLFINTLPVRSCAEPEQPLLSWLKGLQARQTDLTQVEHTPLSQVQKWSEIPAGTQLFESILVFENYPLDVSLFQQNNGFTIEGIQAVEITNYPLTVTAVPHSDLKLLISYDRSRFDDASVTRMLGHMQTILLSMAAAPGQLIREVSWITLTERAQLLVEWNQTNAISPQQCFHQMFEEQARRNPKEIAVTFGDQRMTYAELNQRANQLARHLRKLGVGPEARVGIYLERGTEIVVAVLAVAKAGGAYLPLDPNYPIERLQFTFTDAQAIVLITQSDLKEQLGLLPVRMVVIDEDWKEIAAGSGENLNLAVDERNLAYLIYTSGSTGRPKGVSIEHRNLTNVYHGWAAAYQLDFRTTAHLQMASFSFDVFAGDLVRSLCCGKKLVICPTEYLAMPDRLFQYMVDHQVDAAEFVPVVARNLIAHLRKQGLSLAMDVVVLGSDITTMNDLLELRRCCSDRTLIVNTYGMTECTIDSLCYPYRFEQECLVEAAKGSSAPIGRPLANTCVYVLDPRMQPVPVGIAGELYIGGAGVARGYWSRPELTAEKFLPDPFAGKTGERLYRTGDVGRWLADGSLEFVGRADQQIKIRGYRIEPAEIETALRAHAAVRDAVVMAREQQLVAYLVGLQCDQNSLRQHLKQALPEYMVPAHFVFLDSIPTLPNGKVDRRALPAPNQTPSPRVFVGPRNAMEEALAAIWSALLKVEQVGIEDNFFELGGDSIISLQAVARARQQGIRITPRQLFESPTIAALASAAKLIEDGRKQIAEQGTIEGDVAFTPIQRWFFEQEWEEAHHYNQAALLQAREELNSEWLEEAWKKLVEHHDALRLRYRREGGEWRQRNTGLGGNEFFSMVELKGSGREQETELERLIVGMQKSLDLEHGPMLRVAYVKPGWVVIVIHHLAVDGVSWRILLEDLQNAYRQASRGEEIQLPTKTTSYQTWAAELVREARRYEQELEYWVGIGRGETDEMARDWAGGENRESEREQVKVELAGEETRQLLQEVPGAYHTQINDVLLTAVMGAWESWTGKGRLLIDVEGHGRDLGEGLEGMDVSRTVGWFTSVYPVRLEVGKGEGIGERLKGIKEQLRKVPRRGLGYGVLRYINREKGIRERLRKQAEAEISFNYLGQVDGLLRAGGVFEQAEALEESCRGGRNRRSYLLEVESRVEGGRLQVVWNYSREIHQRETIQRLGQSVLEELKAIIRHCVAPGTGGFTPSDFPLAGLEQNTLDLLIQDHHSISDIYPLSPIQQGLLFHTLYEAADSGTYVEQLSCTLEGNFNIRAFEQAWQEVIDFHPALRAGFVWEGAREPLSVVHHSARALFIHHDWRQLASDQQQQRLEDLRRADAKQEFNLAIPPLMRFTLVQLAHDRFVLLWSSHHLLLDGWSMSLVLQEMLERYAARCAGKSFHPVSHRPYRDYIAWLQRQDLATAEKYWDAILEGFSAAVPLPGEHAAQSLTTDKSYCEQQVTISADTTAFLQTKVRQHQITLNALVQAAWALLLRHYTGNRDLLFGVTVAGRPSELAGVDGMVGIFINTLPLRLSLSSDATLLSILRELQVRQLRLDEYAYAPLSRIQEWSEVPAGLPLFETVVVFENYPVDASLKEPRGELKFSNVQSRASTNYPLTLIIKPGPQLTLQLTYDVRRFELSIISQLLAHLQNLLAGIAADPMARVSDLQLLSEAERQQLLVEWNRTARQYPRDQNIQRLFEEQVRLAPQNIAVVFQDQKLSYAQLNQRGNQLAHYLSKQGVATEARVGVCMERSLEMIVALLGIVKAGGVYVALDPGSPPERLEMMLAESGSRVVITQQSLRQHLPQRASLHIVSVDEEWHRIMEESDENPAVEVSGEHLAYVSYTSGSTGRPKGVSVPHRAVVRLVKNNDYVQLDAEEVILQFAPLAFDASTLEIWGSLLNGGRLVVMPPGPRSTEEIGRVLMDYGVTTAWLTAGLFHVMEDHELKNLKQVRQLLAGGDVLSVSHVNRYLAEIGEHAVLINGYGPTENTTFTCCHRMKNGETIEGTVPIGRPIANTQVYVLDNAEEMQPVPVGVIGELYIGGDGLARGYENDAALTAERFVPHPYGGVGERLYRSGDEVRWRRDGVLEFVGRADRQVKVRGYRVEPAEIELVMMRCAGVREAVVTVQGKEKGEKSLIAYVVAQPDGKLAVPDLQAYLKARLPDYMRPGAIVVLDKLPLTANGKVDYKALPTPETSSTSGGIVPPRTPVEHALADIWRHVFSVDQLSVDDNFFDLGGHSLLALQIASRARTVLGVALPLRSVFEEPTIADQARTVERLLGSGKTPASTEIRPQARLHNPPLSFAQQRLWFLHQLEPASDFYNVPIALRVRGPLDVDVLRDCCGEMVRRHEVLRTTFPIRQGAPAQQIDATVRLPFEMTDLSHLPLEQAETRMGELIAEEARRAFDLSSGPLLRLSLFRLGKEDHALLLNMHHIIVDGWSLGIFTRELAVLYEAFQAGRSSPLPPLSIQYVDYALWQREWLSGELLESQMAYWRQQLSGSSSLELSTDYPRPKVQTFHGAKTSTSLSPQFVASLRELLRRENSTLFMVLLAALKVLLYRYSGQPEITVGTPVAGRTRQETEGLIGFFVNTLALRTRVVGYPRFTEFLHQVRDVSLGAYAHQDLPFDKLVEELHPERDQGRSPLFQVMFALDDLLPQELVLAGLRALPIEIENQTAQFDLTLAIRESFDGLRISFQYNSDLFQGVSIERMMRHFERVLCGIVANPKQSISEISLLSDEEQRQVVVEWNQTMREYPACRTILELLNVQAQRTPENPAVIFEGQCLTYRKLHGQANQLARFLKKLGVGPEVPVGVCMERGLQLVTALLGIMKAGGAYMPLDPGYPVERLNYMLTDARPAVVLVSKDAKQKLQDASTRLVWLEEEWEAIGTESGEAVENDLGGENLAYVIYTSGSTGQPKGVMNVHRGLMNRLQWMQEIYPLDETDRVLQKTPFGFDVSVWEFFWPLMYGAGVVMVRPEGHKDSAYLVRTMQQERITTVHFVPSMLALFLQEAGVEECTSLRRVISSGEALPASLVQNFHKRLQADLHNLYGPTEVSIDVSFWACKAQQSERMNIPIGQPIANTQLYILDFHLHPVPVGVMGELHIGGVGLARGYWRRADLTAEKFIPDPFSGRGGERLYRTGDLARRRADGHIEYLGRLDNQVKLRGYRIELGEIEAVLRQHEEVSQAVVLLRDDASGDKRLVGYAVPQNGADGLFAHNIREYLRTKLPEYMVPAIVQVNEIPLTVNGKIDYNALPVISSSGSSAPRVYVAPRNVLEEQLEKACRDLLGIQRMGVLDNFFDLGGHSLLAMRLMTWTRETFQVETLPLREFFEMPTIAGLAALAVRFEARPGQTEKIAKFLQQLDAMSAEQVMDLRSKHMEQETAQNIVSKQ